MPHRRVIVVLLILAVAVVAARTAAPSHSQQFRFSAALACGVERWKVKTLQDRPRLRRALPIVPVVRTRMKVGLVSPEFHARRDENRVFYAGSLKAAHAWLPFTGLSFKRLDFKRYGLVAVFFRYPPWDDRVLLFESGRGANATLSITVNIQPGGCDCAPSPSCSLWDPTAVFSPEPWGRFVVLVVDKKTLAAPPKRLCLGFVS